MMTVGSVGYLGSAPATSVLGLASVFLYVLPAFVFLVPVSLVAAELASGWQGGVYSWVSEGISPPMGLLAVWCQFSQTIFYYPALLALRGQHACLRDRPATGQQRRLHRSDHHRAVLGRACWCPRAELRLLPGSPPAAR